ncbi:TPM domain-containing protein [Leptospira interrogans]|uniref:TPM domain-containing protein n=1 Tax=Leptospira interrogans TaxID=173 RepID=UPI000773FAB5|nr:TPM domain-containing protein [Leptospira interrogans]
MNLLKARMIQLVTIKILFSVCLLVCTAGIHLKIGNSHSTFIIEEWKAEDQIIPPLRSPVTDATFTLTKEQKVQLTNRLISFETKKGSQIAVLIVDSTGEWSIEEYALKVFEKTKLGRKGIDDGILIVVAIQDHKTKIEVGYGLEGTIPDAIAKRIIEEFMIPHFKNGDYFQGVSDGIDTLILKIDGEELPETNKIPKFFEVINKYSMYIFPSLILVILIITIFITSGIFGTIVLIGGGFFLILMLESIILLVIIFFPLIFFFLMASHLRKKIRIRRKSFITPTNWDYIIIAVFIILGIVSTIGLIGFGIFRGLISESTILGISILILLIFFFLMTGYLRKKIQRKSFWDYIIIAVFIILGIVSTIGLVGFGIFRGLISESMILGIPLILIFLIMGYLRDKIRRKSFWDYILFGTGTSSSGSSSRSSWGSSGSNSSGGSSWSGGGGSSGGGGASGSW